MPTMQLTPRLAITAALALGAAVIGYVLFSQYVQGFQPCELCLRERWPWYAIVAVGLIGLLIPSRGMLALIGVLFIVAAGLGGHHVGVEQHWWPGPSACTGGASGAQTIDELRAFLHGQQAVMCDAITWRLFGLSMATYNFLVSLAAGLAALFVASRIRHG
jgi:disulfide bond formation protein DsbB